MAKIVSVEIIHESFIPRTNTQGIFFGEKLILSNKYLQNLILFKERTNSHSKKIQQVSFSLVELLIVVAILAVLMSLLTPSLKNMTRKADALHCMNLLKNITTGVLLYTDENQGFYPAPPHHKERQFPQSPAQLVGENAVNKSSEYDIRPLLNPFFGGSMNSAFRCPLAPPSWKESSQLEATDFDLGPHPRGPRSFRLPYSLFFGNIRRNESVFDIISHMNQVGDTFEFGASSGAAQGKQFRVIAGDLLMQGPDRQRYSSHPTFDEVSEDKGNWANLGFAWKTISFHELDSNFAFDDGSVLLVDAITKSDGVESQDRLYRTGMRLRAHHLLPFEKSQ